MKKQTHETDLFPNVDPGVTLEKRGSRDGGRPSMKDEDNMLNFRKTECMEVGPDDHRIDGQLQMALHEKEVRPRHVDGEVIHVQKALNTRRKSTNNNAKHRTLNTLPCEKSSSC